MEIIYEASAYPLPSKDFSNEAEARAYVEASGNEGRVVHFVKDFDGRCRSSAMNVFRAGKWDGVNIHE